VKRTAASPVGTGELDALFSGLEAATGIVVAVSGGPDSTALMHLLARWAANHRAVPVLAATVDHGLRPEATEEARTVGRRAAEIGLEHRVLAWEGPKPRTRIQELARAERYRLLVALAREAGASHVVTGHTLDDQAETVVMRLIGGTDIGGLSGMSPAVARDGVTVARPFLGLPKARLVATCRAEGWPYAEDPSNADPRFARTRLRKEVMPRLAREGLTLERLAVLATRARRAADALDARVIQVLALADLPEEAASPSEAPRLALDGARLQAEPDAVLLRAMARAIAEVAGAAAAAPVRLEKLEARVLGDLRRALALGEPLRMTLGGALIDVKSNGRLVLTTEPARGARHRKSNLTR
jgi:tRNA(Ile)-lysidine synthase